MIGLVAILVATSCAHALDLMQAEKLVLAAPNVRASATERGARPFFEYIGRAPEGWSLTVNAANPCPIANPCSALIGHDAVNRHTGDVENLDAGDDGELVSDARIRRLQREMGCRR